MLELRNIAKMVGGDYHIYPTNLTLKRGTLNVLLGPTLSGKTSLMRLMAGLDTPTEGWLVFDGTDVTGNACRIAALPWSTSSSSIIPRFPFTKTSPPRCGLQKRIMRRSTARFEKRPTC